MIVAPLAEIKAKFSDYVIKSRHETIIVTKKGRPAAALIAIKDSKDLAALVSDKKVKLADVLKKSRKAISKDGGIPHDEFWKKMGI